MKKLVLPMLTFFLLLSSAGLAATLPLGNGYRNIGGPGPKDIYSAPDINAEVIDTLAVGAPCNYPTIPPQAASSNSMAAQAPPQDNAVTTYGTAILCSPASQPLHLYAEASVRAESLGSYYTGVEVVCRTDPTQKWVIVRIGNRSGYIKSVFLYNGIDPESVAPKTPIAVVSHNAQGEWLNLRNEPSRESHVLGRFYNGDVVTVLGIAGDWYHVQTVRSDGFMLANYLEILNVTPSPMPVGSRKYAVTQYIPRGYTVDALMTETSVNHFDVSVQVIIDPAVMLNSYPIGYHLYINGRMEADLPTTQDTNIVSIATRFAGSASFAHEITRVQVVPVNQDDAPIHDEAVFLR